MAELLGLIDMASLIYDLSDKVSILPNLSIAGGVSVVGENTSAIMSGRCCTTVGGGGGCEEVWFRSE